MSKKVALVLGSGGARGYAHIGVIEELGCELAETLTGDLVGVCFGEQIGLFDTDPAGQQQAIEAEVQRRLEAARQEEQENEKPPPQPSPASEE